MKKSTILLSGVSAVALAYSASAETANPSAQAALSTLNAGGGSESVQWQVRPTYSEDFGLGVHTSMGGYVSDDFALGMIVDYSAHRQEYLANAGIQLNDKTRLIGSFGLLKESEEFVLGDGRKDVSQREYGLSLNGSYDAGIIRGYEINAYHTNASGDTDSVETGDLTGIQAITQLKPSDASEWRVGAGFERATWDGGDVNEGLTLQALGSQKITDTLSLNFNAKSAETENDYGLGLTYDLSTAEIQHSALTVNLTRIEGEHGISDDTRVAVTWTVGFGAGSGNPDATVATMGSTRAMLYNGLLDSVMKRPEFLPKRVLSRAQHAGLQSCESLGFIVSDENGDSGQFLLNQFLEVWYTTLNVSKDGAFDPYVYDQGLATLGGIPNSRSIGKIPNSVGITFIGNGTSPFISGITYDFVLNYNNISCSQKLIAIVKVF